MSAAPPSDDRFLAPPKGFSDLETAGVIVLPVPFETISSYGQGSRGGPDAIIEASRQVEFFDAALGFEPFRACNGIGTLPPLLVAGHDGALMATRVRAAVKAWLDRGRFVVTVGGEHTSVIGAIRAHCEHFEHVTVLHVDAHGDLRSEYDGSPWSHACAMTHVLGFHNALVQVGVRSQDADERRLVERKKIPNFYAHAIHEDDERGRDWIGGVIAATRQRVYVTFDCDVLDPSIVPATGAPEPGGLTWRQADRLFGRLCRERELVGFDVSELAPIAGLSAPQFTIAKLIYRVLGYRFGKA